MNDYVFFVTDSVLSYWLNFVTEHFLWPIVKLSDFCNLDPL
jgi:hypothetical protein